MSFHSDSVSLVMVTHIAMELLVIYHYVCVLVAMVILIVMMLWVSYYPVSALNVG